MQGSLLAKIFQVDVKLKLDDPSTMQLNVGKSPGIDGIPTEVFQNGGEAELEKLQDLFINCRQRKGLYLKTPRMQSSSLGTNTREKNLTVQTTRHHPTLHCSHNLGSCLAEQARSEDRTGKHARELVWIQVQHRDHRQGLHAGNEALTS